LTIANMTTEWGALTGWFPADGTTLDYLRTRKAVLASTGIERFTDADLERWTADPVEADPDAAVAGRIVLDLGDVSPHVSGPDTVQVMRSLVEIGEERVAIQKAYLLSCVNGRLEDIEAAAAVLRGHKVAPGVSFYVAAASAEIQAAAERSGAWGTLLDAGAHALPPGCGPCIGLGSGLLEAGEVGISATNRNFKGRMGSRDARVYLGSPAVVAASAVAGHITDAVESDGRVPSYAFEKTAAAGGGGERVTIQAGFPERVEGRLVFLPRDNLNTDGIYGKDYTYRDLAREEMARVALQNYDPAFVERSHAGDVLVGGYNFGTGSSREQAATCLQAAGIPLVIAGSFSQTYLRNAFNNGLVCIECPELVDGLKAGHAAAIAGGELTLIPGNTIEVDFASSTARYGGREYGFPALGSVPQSLVIAGGVENLVKQRLGL
jgi:homoaconitate hydratase